MIKVVNVWVLETPTYDTYNYGTLYITSCTMNIFASKIKKKLIVLRVIIQDFRVLLKPT